MAYSRVTKKGQITIPSFLRAKHALQEGVVVAFKETPKGLLIEPVPDIADSTGKLSRFGNADEAIRDLLRSREHEFR